jgi:hypothetical protein
MPQRATYGDESETHSNPPAGDEDDELDNEGKNELYWIHLMEYETTQLRRLYHASMRQMVPGWDTQVEDSALKQLCGGCLSLRGWVRSEVDRAVD